MRYSPILAQSRAAVDAAQGNLEVADSGFYHRRGAPEEVRVEGGETQVLKLRPVAEIHPAQLPGGGAAGLQAGGHPSLVAAATASHAGSDDRKSYGLEAVKAVLGHTDTKITEIYAEHDLELAMRIMREIG